MLFKRKQIGVVEKQITLDDASAIYELLKEKTPQQIRLSTKYKGRDIKEVVKEIKRLESEINLKMSGGYVVETVTDEEGNEAKQYYEPSTKSNLKKTLSSDILDVATVINDVILWSDGEPEIEKSWVKFKKSFEPDEI